MDIPTPPTSEPAIDRAVLVAVVTVVAAAVIIGSWYTIHQFNAIKDMAGHSSHEASASSYNR